MIYIILFIALVFSIAINTRHKNEDVVNSMLKTVIVYSVFFMFARINNVLMESSSKAPLTILILIALAATLTYQYRQSDINE